MGWIIEAITTWIWIDVIEALGRGKPWWVKALLIVSPVFILAALVGLVWLLVVAAGA